MEFNRELKTKFNLELKKKIVKNGESKIFESWKEHSNITMEEFLEALEWLCNDPRNGGEDKNKLTREIGLSPKGIVMLERAYIEGHPMLYKDGHLWEGEFFTVPCENPDYADKNGMITMNQMITLTAYDHVEGK